MGGDVTKERHGNLPSWPDWQRLRAYAIFMAVFYLAFFPVYIGAGLITEASGRAMTLHVAWERDLPLVPWMIWPYLSLYVLFLLPLFHMERDALHGLAKQSIIALLVAGAIFLIMPGELGFPERPVQGFHAPVFETMRATDTPYNLVPSLHVTFAALLILGSSETAPTELKFFYWSWLALMAVATMLVHQHHALDVLSGLLLAVILRKAMPLTPPAAGG